MSPISLQLQSFDPEGPEAETGPSEEFLAGYAEGYEKGRAEAEADQDYLRGSLVQTINDLEFPFSEARRAVLDALGPMFRVILEGLAPHMATEALTADLLARLLEAARRDSAECVTIHVASEDAGALEAALAHLERIPFRIVRDPALRSVEAIWSTEISETSLDFATMLAEMREALAALITPPQAETTQHG